MENVIGETHLGNKIFRFYFKCTQCSAELIIKTNPQNSDYVVESGATTNFEPWGAEDEEIDEIKKKREAEELRDTMKSLENQTLDSKREMDILAALDETRSMKSRHATLSVDEMLAALQRSAADKEKILEGEEDDALIKSIFYNNSEVYIRRTRDECIETDDEEMLRLSNEHSKDLRGKAIDTLTKASLDDYSRSSHPKLNHLVKISVIKNPVTSNTTSGLQSCAKTM